MQWLQRAGISPKKHVLENEVSGAMKNLIWEKYRMELEHVPPGCHRRNAAKVAIRNFKSHFQSILAGVSDDFPLQLWDCLLPQAEITINLLRQSNAAPKVSAYAHLSGAFDYNKMPLAPMGCNVQVHEKADQRGTWAFHSVDGWYLFTSPEHCHTHRCYVRGTGSECLSNTVQSMHKHITNPTITHGDKVMRAIAECAKALRGMSRGEATQEMEELKRIIDTITVKGAQQSERTVPRVPKHEPTPQRWIT